MGAAAQVILFGLLMMGLFSIANDINKQMAEVITLPLNAVVVKGELGSGRDSENITRLIANANDIWEQANVSFEIKRISVTEVGSEKVLDVLGGYGAILTAIDGYDRNAVNMFFVKNMSFNGISFPKHLSVVMPDRTTNREYVAAAHELGHIVGLNHNPEERYLMYAVCNGTVISLAETLEARNNAKKLLAGFNSNTMVLPPASVEFSVIS